MGHTWAESSEDVASCAAGLPGKREDSLPSSVRITAGSGPTSVRPLGSLLGRFAVQGISRISVRVVVVLVHSCRAALIGSVLHICNLESNSFEVVGGTREPLWTWSARAEWAEAPGSRAHDACSVLPQLSSPALDMPYAAPNLEQCQTVCGFLRAKPMSGTARHASDACWVNNRPSGVRWQVRLRGSRSSAPALGGSGLGGPQAQECGFLP
ncbi:PREDICTED: uncharacterized protein LOC106146362 [Chinchilla lanigera]|uniref:uncharacterized protein LOC106146362 n=1 Tax=Chinchilla lanigera TaxID=34839 RepID=UPI0006982682|nr:PREDICTED: uncharacterized protein LOC106146362 [Chinchilla lanigera]